MVYLDDVVVFSSNQEDHVKDVQAVLDSIHRAGLTLKRTKCHLGLPQVDLLGYTVSGRGIAQQEDKVQAIRGMATRLTSKPSNTSWG